jgi:hypothetical protein
MEGLRIEWAAEKRRTFEDRAINGLNGRQRISGTDLNLLRTRLDFLMLHSMMLRGESTRKAELADLCSVLLPDEGSECLGLVPPHQHRQDHPTGAGRKPPHAALPRGATPSRPRPLPGRRPRLAGKKFLSLLQRLRYVFLQDAALLQPLFPQSRLWRLALFQDPAWPPFVERVCAAEAV